MALSSVSNPLDKRFASSIYSGREGDIFICGVRLQLSSKFVMTVYGATFFICSTLNCPIVIF